MGRTLCVHDSCPYKDKGGSPGEARTANIPWEASVHFCLFRLCPGIIIIFSNTFSNIHFSQALKIFSGNCQPVWIFVASGKIFSFLPYFLFTFLHCSSGSVLGAVHGPNVPVIKQSILKFLRQEIAVEEGQAVREDVSLQSLVKSLGSFYFFWI